MTVTIIPAKAQSSRLKNKNMSIVAGRPMLDWSIFCALRSEVSEAVFVSSECEDIRNHAQKLGAGAIIRPNNLLGETPIVEVYKHAVEYLEQSGLSDRVTNVIGLQPDHPDRTVSIDYAYEFFINNGLDQLFTCDASGVKNGSYYIISRHCLDGNSSRKDATLVDDCTNVHFQNDLENAELKLRQEALYCG
jgi:CMP-N-acetylneuraminic acid synthetase